MKMQARARTLYAAAVLCTLGVGATAVLAAPAQANWPYSCNARECSDGCVGNGARGGYCNYHDDSCECVW